MKINSNELDSLICWVCTDCGNKANPNALDLAGTTFHTNVCDVCGEYKGVCHVRNFGFPVFEMEGK